MAKNSSAMDIAKDMVPNGTSTDPAKAFDSRWGQTQSKFGKAAVPQFKAKAKPMQVVHALKEAVEADIDETMELLLDRSDLLRTFQVKKSLASVSSGLKCWHHFAAGVLSYPSNGTLPPRLCRDVCLYVGIFCNSGTAANYISYLRFGCVSNGYDISWWDLPPLKMTLKGLTKATIEHFVGPMRVHFPLMDRWVWIMITHEKRNGNSRRAMCYLTNWEFLLRTHSEGLVVWKGEPSDPTTKPKARRNGLWIDSKKQLAMWMKVRKNRPLGSTLVRACSCSLTGNDFCAACQVGRYMESFSTGEVLWDLEAKGFLILLRETLVKKCGAPNGAKASFKSFRAGKATQLLKQNVQAPVIMDRAEWKHTKTIALEMGRGSNVLPEVKEAQTTEPVTDGQGATMGMSKVESIAQSPEVTVASQATEVEPPP